MISHAAALFFNTRPLRLTIFNPYRSNVEINTTLLTVVLYQMPSRAHIDTLF